MFDQDVRPDRFYIVPAYVQWNSSDFHASEVDRVQSAFRIELCLLVSALLSIGNTVNLHVSEPSLFQTVDEEKSFHVLVDVAPEAHVGL